MDITKLTDEQQVHVLHKMEELVKSDGWEMLKSIVLNEIELMYRKLSSPQQAGADLPTVRYHLGIIESSYRLNELPDKVISTLKEDIKFKQQVAAANALPPTT